MKFIKKNIKIIIGFIVVAILASGITVYATYKYFATDVSYTKDGTEISVAQALNELYKNKKETTDETLQITTNNKYSLGKYYNNIDVNVPIPEGYIKPSGTFNIDRNGDYSVSSYENVKVNVTVNGWTYVELDIPEDGSDTVYNCGYKPEFICGYVENKDKTSRLPFFVSGVNGKTCGWGVNEDGNWYGPLDVTSINEISSSGYTFKTTGDVFGGKMYLWVKKQT